MRARLIPFALGIGASLIGRAAFAQDAPLALRLSMTLGEQPPARLQLASARVMPEHRLALHRTDVLPSRKAATQEPREPARDPARQTLLEQARLWQSRNRDDLAAEALNRLLTIVPDDPEALTELALLHLRGGRQAETRQTLDRLRRVAPGHSGVARVTTMLRLEGEDKEKLRQARNLGKAGRTEEAVTALRALYPDGPPTGDLALEYWQLIGDTRDGWDAAYAGLRRLAADYPDNLRYRLALAEHITVRRPDDAAALKTIRDLSTLPAFNRPARAAWRRAMLRLDARPSSVALIEQYLANEEVEDQAVKEHLASLRGAIERHRRLMADPHYRAQLDGLALLEKNRLDEAGERLAYAAETRGDDPDLLDGLGRLRMRQGHHIEAQAYFAQGARKNPQRFAGLLRTAQFWGLMREAADAVDAGEFRLAESKLQDARALDAREPAMWNALARLRLAQGQANEAEAAYRNALAIEPANEGAIEGLAALYLRSGRETQIDGLFARLSAAQRRTAQVALDAARAAVFKEQANALLVQKDARGAASMLEQAARYDRDDAWLRYDLARLYAELGEAPCGDALFEELLARHPDDATARYAHALHLSKQERGIDALTTLERIPAPRRDAEATALQRRLWIGAVTQHADALARQGRPQAARRLLDAAQAQAGTDPEALLSLADARLDTGDLENAHRMLVRLSGMPAPSVDWRLRHARLLAGAGGNDLVPPLLADIAALPLTPEQRVALDDVKIDLALRDAAALRAAGKPDAALAALTALRQTHPENERLLAAEARVLRTMERRTEALAAFDQLAALNPADRDYRIARIELLLELGRTNEARRAVDAELAMAGEASADQAADLAASLFDLGDDATAQRLIDDGLRGAPGHPRLLDMAGRIALRGGRIEEALELQQASLAADHARAPQPLTLLRPSIDGRPPAADRVAPAAPPGIDYAHRRFAELLDARTTWIAGALDVRTRSGTDGMSSYSARELPLEWKSPQTRDGRWTYHADLVEIDAGRLDLMESGTRFGTLPACSGNCIADYVGRGLVRVRGNVTQPYTTDDVIDIHPSLRYTEQNARGIALNAALERDGVRYDIGTTPLGFPVQSLVGGVLIKGDLGKFGYSVDISRRPLAGSLLSYAGQVDPLSGRTWGGVRATGMRFGLSRDDGGSFGFWSSLGLHALTGTNVASNRRMQLMAGGIWRVINENDRLLQFGVTGMHWLMSRNAGEYTFGHGGYYSPRRYSSLSLPVTYGERFERWSYALRASISVSRSRASDAPYFPTDAGLQADSGDLKYTPDPRGRGVGRSLAFSAEYQATPHLYLGTRLELDRSPDYAPNRFAVYLRYALDRQSAKPVAFLPEPLNPVSQY